nr:MAG TPA: hypothetical protein [Caudoviricetes sp.]
MITQTRTAQSHKGILLSTFRLLCRFFHPAAGHIEPAHILFDTYKASLRFQCRDAGCAAAHERIEDNLAFARIRAYQPVHQIDGFSRRVPAFAAVPFAADDASGIAQAVRVFRSGVARVVIYDGGFTSTPLYIGLTTSLLRVVFRGLSVKHGDQLMGPERFSVRIQKARGRAFFIDQIIAEERAVAVHHINPKRPDTKNSHNGAFFCNRSYLFPKRGHTCGDGVPCTFRLSVGRIGQHSVDVVRELNVKIVGMIQRGGADMLNPHSSPPDPNPPGCTPPVSQK